jgi:hypothetical protein
MNSSKQDAARRQTKATYRVYVIELRAEIIERDRKFRKANPQYQEGRECLYVGMTGLTRRARWKQHRRGYKASRRTKKYGMRLRRDLSGTYGLMTFENALTAEKTLAEALRAQGYPVWQN